MQINARPHINGNSLQDFYEAYNAISVATQAIDDAAALLSRNVIHGRNYQHITDAEDAEDELIRDRRNLHSNLQAARNALNSIASALVDATDLD